jgi:hypothetical protein
MAGSSREKSPLTRVPEISWGGQGGAGRTRDRLQAEGWKGTALVGYRCATYMETGLGVRALEGHLHLAAGFGLEHDTPYLDTELPL